LLSKQNGCRKSTCKRQISKKKLKKLNHSLKAKQATIYGVTLFPKDKSTF
jgi:hypothetical protein